MLFDRCVDTFMNYFDSTWKLLDDFLWLLDTAAQPDHFNWVLLPVKSGRKSLLLLSHESSCQSQCNWHCAILIGHNIPVNIIEMCCFDGKCSLRHARGLKVLTFTGGFLGSLVYFSGIFTSLECWRGLVFSFRTQKLSINSMQLWRIFSTLKFFL